MKIHLTLGGTTHLVPSTWYQVPSTGGQVPGHTYQDPGTRYLYQIPGTCWYQVPGARYLVPGTSPFTSTRYVVPGTRHQVPAIWYLVPGNRLPGTWYATDAYPYGRMWVCTFFLYKIQLAKSVYPSCPWNRTFANETSSSFGFFLSLYQCH